MKRSCALLRLGLVLLVASGSVAAEDARINRHALIIGVGNYVDARITPLRGVVHDVINASQMAQAMGVPSSNLRVLQDRDATYANIRKELRGLSARVRDGDRVFLYYSGHGARFALPDAPGTCKEALVPADVDAGSKSGLLTQEDIAADIAPVYAKADKVFVFIDACHSGGIRAVMRRPTAAAEPGDEWEPKFTNLDVQAPCRLASNVRTRSVGEAARARGAPGRNVVQLSSSRPDEVSLDSPKTGGLATSSWKYCSTYADDKDSSGALSVAEIAACVQRRINEQLSTSTRFSGQNLVVTGNADFAPALTGVVHAATGPTNSGTGVPPAAGAQERVASQAASAQPPAVAQVGTRQRFPLESVLAQSDERHVVTVRHTQKSLRIGVDYFDFSVTSPRGGYVYAILQSSDMESTYVLFPNALDQNNRLAAGQSMQLPRASWRLQSQGPAGTNRLLVMVTDAPRDLTVLRTRRDGPFVKSLGDLSAAQSLAWVVGSARGSGGSRCTAELSGKDLIAVDECSDSFGAAIVEFVERQ